MNVAGRETGKLSLRAQGRFSERLLFITTRYILHMSEQTNTTSSLLLKQLVSGLEDSAVDLSGGKGVQLTGCVISAGILSVEPWG